MTQGKPAQLILKFALPLVIANVFQQAYGIADNIIVGRFVGADAFAAVGATIAPSSVLSALCIGATVGFGVVISQYFGAKDEENAAAAIINGFYVCFAVAALIIGIGLFFTEYILRLLNTPGALMLDATVYMRTLTGGFLGVAAYYGVFSALRAFGDSKTPLYFIIGSNILNIGLDILFVVSLRMGVYGAALATVLSQLIAAVICIVYAFKTMPHFKKALRCLKPNGVLIKQIAKIALPSAFQYSLVFLSSAALQWIINGFGTSVIGAFAASSRVEMLVRQPFYALSVSVATFTGQNVGAKQHDRVKEGICVVAKAALFYSATLFVLFWFAGHFVMSMFVNDTQIISFAATGIRIDSFLFFAMGMSQVFRNMLTGAGDSLYAMGNGIVEMAGRVGLAMLLTRVAFIGVWGLWAASALTWLIACLFALWRYRNGSWAEKPLTNNVRREVAVA